MVVEAEPPVTKVTGGTLASHLFRLVALSGVVVAGAVVAVEAFHLIPMVHSLPHHGVRSVTIHLSHWVTPRRNVP